jgi:hypothetical protein
MNIININTTKFLSDASLLAIEKRLKKEGYSNSYITTFIQGTTTSAIIIGLRMLQSTSVHNGKSMGDVDFVADVMEANNSAITDLKNSLDIFDGFKFTIVEQDESPRFLLKFIGCPCAVEGADDDIVEALNRLAIEWQKVKDRYTANKQPSPKPDTNQKYC